MTITFLGTGTSDGVPMIGCDCDVCLSRDKRDKRLRSSVLITSKNKNYIIDTSSDFREQMLKHKVKNLECVLFTHHHADHVSGIVDIRALNFAMGGRSINCYGNDETINTLKDRYSFFFNPAQMGGGLPLVNFTTIDSALQINDLTITPLKINHGKLNILGYKINNLAYITDASFIPEETIEQVKGVDVLVLNALRYRSHGTHLSIREAVDIADIIGARETYFTHMTHDVSHKRLSRELPHGLHPAFDNLKLEI